MIRFIWAALIRGDKASKFTCAAAGACPDKVTVDEGRHRMFGCSETVHYLLRYASGLIAAQGGWVSSVLQVLYGANLAVSYVVAKDGQLCLVSNIFIKTTPCTNKTDY